MKRAWLAFPRQTYNGLRQFVTLKPPKPLLADQVFTLSPKPNPPVIARATGRHLDLNQRDIYIYIYTQRVGGLSLCGTLAISLVLLLSVMVDVAFIETKIGASGSIE